MSELWKRTLIGAGAFLIVSLFFFFPYKPLVALALLLISLACCWEYLSLVEKKAVFLFKPLFIAAPFISILFFNFEWSLPLLLFFLLFLSFLSNGMVIEGAFTRISYSLLGLIYIVLPLGMLLTIFSRSPFWALFLLSVTKAADVGGYFGGKLTGKKLLISAISPKKTVEGALWGLFSSLLVSLIFVLVEGNFVLLWWGLILAIFAQAGDFAESILKRDGGIKDSGVIPGLGGVLDMVDSLLFNIFIIYFVVV